jgi:hypothetical protein
VAAIARFATWVCILELLWGVLVGTTQSTELLAGLAAAVVVATFVEALRNLGVLDFTPTGRGLERLWRLPGNVVFDFLLVLAILARAIASRRRVAGEWVEAPFGFERGPRGRFARSLVVVLGNESANTIVVELGGDGVLLHSLDPRAYTGRSVL